ncbi:Retrovirus-related Pol poly from transposon 412, partial [Paramuricea clavata]
MCRLLGIKKTRTTPLHPQSDGMVERYNRTLKRQLSLFVEEHQRDWDVHIPLLLMAYRTAVHNSTKFTPARLMMGHEIRAPIDLTYGSPEDERAENLPQYVQDLQQSLEEVHEFARKHSTRNYYDMEKRYNANSNAYTLEEKILVWLYNPRKKKGRTPKLTRPWEGPFVIVKKLNDLVYRIQRNKQSKPKVVHRNRLWKFRGEQEDLWKYEDQPSTGTGGVEKEDGTSDDHEELPTTSTSSTTLRRSSRNRKPRN